jgi:hypothetical protein
MGSIAVIMAVILMAWGEPQDAHDLGTIGRAIWKEPVYRSEEPRYGLLVLGPKADTCIWVVLDLAYDPLREEPGVKDSLYVDVNGDGDLTDPRERIPVTVITKKSSELGLPTRIGSLVLEDHDMHVPRFHVGDVKGHDGKTVYAEMVVDVGWYIFGRKDRKVTVSVDVPGYGRQSVGGEQLWFADRPVKAPVIWFDGPLTLRLAPSGLLHLPVDYTGKEPPPPWYEEFPLVRGATMPLRAQIGWAGVGLGTFHALSNEQPPQDVHPIAKVVFPHAESERPPIEVSVELSKRCCGTLFEGRVPVPADAALGKAKVILSFPGWRSANVGPAVTEVEVSDQDIRPEAFR